MGRRYGKSRISSYSMRGGVRVIVSGNTESSLGRFIGGGWWGVGGRNSSRPRKNDLLEMRKGGDRVSAGAAFSASALAEATANNRQKNLFSSAGMGGSVPKRMG